VQLEVPLALVPVRSALLVAVAPAAVLTLALVAGY
jgi:hypothetical protein